MRVELESPYNLPIYETPHYKYIRIGDLGGFEALELQRWIFGQTCPLIQGEGKGVREIQDAVFLDDYMRFIERQKGKEVKIGT